PSGATAFPYTTLFRSSQRCVQISMDVSGKIGNVGIIDRILQREPAVTAELVAQGNHDLDRPAWPDLLAVGVYKPGTTRIGRLVRSEEHTSELQSVAIS